MNIATLAVDDAPCAAVMSALDLREAFADNLRPVALRGSGD